MDAVQQLRDLATARGTALRPGLDPAGIAAVAARHPVPLPAELAAALAVTTGLDGPLDLDLTGDRHDVETAELLPAGHPVAADGAGNFWLLDLTPDTTDVAPVFFLSHDPPVLTYTAPDLAAFLGLVAAGALPDASAHAVWGRRPGATSYASAVTGPDQALHDFAAVTGDGWTYVDLRQRVAGDGVAWGRYGPRTRLARAGWERIFAYAPYEAPRRSWRRLGRVTR